MPLKVYTVPTSPWCKRAIAFLNSKRLAFEEVDVTRRRASLDELRALSGQIGVPVTTDGRTVVIGFDVAALGKFAKAGRV